MNSSSQEKKNKKFSSVFIYSSIIAAIVVIIGAVWPEKFDSVTNTAKMWITNNLGWYYLILTTVIVFFCVFLIFSPIGKLKLGKPNDKPEFNTISWFAMLFSAGMGIIIVVVTILFIASAWSGLSKGIQYLSNLNIGLGTILMIVTLIVGPTVLILNMMTSSTGSLLNSFLFNSFDTAALNGQKRDWMSTWTLYYWGWLLSWSPFVGVFIARVSKGRSIREFISGVLLVPALVSFIWFSVFGVLGIEAGKKDSGLFKMSPETQLFGVFNHIPLGIVLSIIALLLIASFFVTSADSATFVLGMQTTFGSLNPSSLVKVTWGVAQALIAFVLLLAGGGDGSKALNAIQSAAIISAFPFSFVVIMMMISFYKDANKERKFLGLTLTPNKHRLQEYVKYQQEDYETDILEKREVRRNKEKEE